MRVGFISDIHFDKISMDMLSVIDIFSSLIIEKGLSYVVIGGDVSDNYKTTFEFVEELERRSKAKVLYIPGNHDYWQVGLDKDDINSWDIYEKYVDHDSCLVEKTYYLNDTTALVGHSAWYNHAVYDKRFSEEELEKGEYNQRTWKDKLHTNWGMTDIELSKLFSTKVEKQLAEIEEGVDIILVTHMVTIEEFCVKMPHDAFDYFNAFIATDDFKDMYKKYNITYSFMGHVHYRRNLEKDGIKYVVNCLGNPYEWKSSDLKAELEDALYVLEVDELGSK